MNSYTIIFTASIISNFGAIPNDATLLEEPSAGNLTDESGSGR